MRRGWSTGNLEGRICHYTKRAWVSPTYHNCTPDHDHDCDGRHLNRDGYWTTLSTIRNAYCPKGYFPSSRATRCYHEINEGTVTGTGGTQATEAELEDKDPGFRERLRRNAARWYRRADPSHIPDPNWLVFPPKPHVQPRRDRVLAGVPAYISLNNVPKSCTPLEDPKPPSSPGRYDWRGCRLGVVERKEAGFIAITWPTRATPMIDTVSRWAGNRHRAVAAEKVVITAEDTHRGLNQTHTCFTETTDIAAAETTRGWAGDKGYAAPGRRLVDSRPVLEPRDPLVYPQDEECAIVFEAPGTYTVTVTIHWIGAQWQTSNLAALGLQDRTPDPLPWDSTLLGTRSTTSATLTVGVCEVRTLPTDRLPASPTAGQARSCIDGDNH